MSVANMTGDEEQLGSCVGVEARRRRRCGALFYVKPRLNIIPLALNSRDTKYCCEVWLTRGGNIASGIDENWEHYSSLVVHSAPGCPLITYAEVGSRAEAVRLGRPDHSAY